jgi:hypothetical protein
MRTVTKFLAAAAIAAVSIASNAAGITSWTGTLSASKLQFYPTNGVDGSALIISGITTSTCSLAAFGGKYVTVASDNVANTIGVSDSLAMLTAAKTAGATVTITFDTSAASCPILSITR